MKEIFANITIMDIVDILIIAFVIYKFLNFLRETRAAQLVKGILVLIVATIVSQWLHLYTVHWILSQAMTVGLLALVIIFQPELRRLLENLGGKTKFTNFVTDKNNEELERIVREITEAVTDFSGSRTGALIVIERDVQLGDIAETGTKLNSRISSQLIGNIFYKGSPLHDGAMIIRGNEILAAGCVLPLTEDKSLPSHYGTRHRAGIGMSENSDAFVIVVSEETGDVSICENGKIRTVSKPKEFKAELEKIYTPADPKDIKKKFLKAINVKGKVNKDDKQ